MERVPGVRYRYYHFYGGTTATTNPLVSFYAPRDTVAAGGGGGKGDREIKGENMLRVSWHAERTMRWN